MKTIQDNKKTPDKLWKLIKLALKDLKELEKNPRIKINMGAWHKMVGKKCLVCLGGAYLHCEVMGRKKFETKFIHDLDLETIKLMLCLDSLRVGNLVGAVCSFYNATYHASPPNRHMIYFEEDQKGWWKDMKQILKELKEYDV